MLKLLSYPIKENMPTWPGNPSVKLLPGSQIMAGKSSNSFMLEIYNHYGTHMDGPRHFNPNGLSIAELPFDSFIFDKPLLVDVHKKAGQKIKPDDLEIFVPEIQKSDLLLIRTGFYQVRKDNPDIYENSGPAVSSKTAKWLVEKFPGLKAIALDFVSLASYSDRADGTLAHQILLGKTQEKFICIIEDVNLGGLQNSHLKKVFAIPLLVEGMDSSPVTMWAEMAD